MTPARDHRSTGGSNGQRIWGILMIGVSVAGVSLYATTHPETIGTAWRYERSAVLAGQWYRLFTAHLVHGGIAHWMLNMAGLALILAVFPQCWTVRRLAWLIPLTAWPVAAGLLYLHPEVVWYVGFSGVLHGLFVFGATKKALEGYRVYALALLIIWGKVVYEQLAGPTVAAWASMDLPVVVAAHLFGALAGGALAIIISLAECLPGSRMSGFCLCRGLKKDGAKRTAQPRRTFSGSRPETCR
jgi:rhomboid family GlyGly-CTERM serine protease